MKKIIFSILAFAALLVSCSSNADMAGTTTASTGTTVSATVASYVAQNYPATKVVSSTATSTGSTVTLNTGETLSFSKAGSVLAYSNNSSAGLLADSLVVTDSIRPDGRGGKEHRGGHGHCKGPFGPGPQHPGDSVQMKPGHPRHFENEIAVDSLPAAINEYILSNYAGLKVIHAEIDTICQGVVTEVLVCSTTKEPVKLVFAATGTYLFKAERMKYADVPALVSAAVTANYSTYTIMKRAEKFTLADASIQYKVFMHLTNVRHAVTFNADGTIACEK